MPCLLGASLPVLLFGWAAASGSTAGRARRPGSSLLQSVALPTLLETGVKEEKAEGAASARVQNLLAVVARLDGTGHGATDMASASQEVDALASLVKTWSASGASGDIRTHLSGIDKHELKRIQGVINTTLLRNLGNFTAEDQAEVSSDHSVLAACDTAREAAEDGKLAVALSALGSAREGHKECRSTEAAAVAAERLAKAELDGLEQTTPEPPDRWFCPLFLKKAEYFDREMNALKKWYDDYTPIFASAEAAAANASQEAEAQKARCNGMQQVLEQRYCSYAQELGSTCGAYSSCRQASLPKYRATVQRVRQNVVGRKALYKSALAIICHLDVILGEDSRSHDECAGLTAGRNASDLDISYPAEPDESPCSTSGFTRSPCDAAWIADEFSAWMPAGVSPASCSRCSWEGTPAPTPVVSPCAGATPAGSTAWVDYFAKGIYVDVDTSACGLTQTPVYITSLSADGATGNSHSGASNVYHASATGFRLYIHDPWTHDPALANQRRFRVNWIASSSEAPLVASCSGLSAAWMQGRTNDSIYSDTDTSGCGFGGTPTYVTSMTGGMHWVTRGAGAIYDANATGFRSWIYKSDGATPAYASRYGWKINWIGHDPSQNAGKVCSGSTVPGATAWETNQSHITLRVDTSACGFQVTPVYVTSLGGDGNHYTAAGAAEVYQESATGFTAHVRAGRYVTAITPEYANSMRWYLNWVAAEAAPTTATTTTTTTP